MKLTNPKVLSLASALTLSFAPTLVTGGLSPAFAASALSAIDTDKDGTIDLAEAKAAAGALFDKLDVDHDGTLDRKELGGAFHRTIGLRPIPTTTRP